MRRAILVMDMPESCDMCDFVDNNQPPIYGVDKMYCGFPGIGDDVSDYIACRPDWCPLRPMPEKREADPAIDNDIIDWGLAEGWNACIDEMVSNARSE